MTVVSRILSVRRHGRKNATETRHQEAVGRDGLTEAQRRRLRANFRSGMGLRPNPEEFQREADLWADKLACAGTSKHR